MSGDGEDPVLVAMLVRAAADTVWRFLTVDRHQWWPDLVFDATPGASLTETWVEAGEPRRATGAVTRSDPPDLLAFSWREPGWNAPLSVTFRLVATDGGTTVTVVEVGFDAARTTPSLRGEHEIGWRHHLEALARCCEAEQGHSFDS